MGMRPSERRLSDFHKRSQKLGLSFAIRKLTIMIRVHLESGCTLTPPSPSTIMRLQPMFPDPGTASPIGLKGCGSHRISSYQADLWELTKHLSKMKPDMGKRINVLHVIEFALSLGVAVCFADNDCINCGKHIVEMQFITASAYGILMFMSVIFLGLFFKEDVGPKTDMFYNALGGCMSVISGILGFVYASKNADNMKDYNYYRLLIGGSCFLLNGVLFLAELFILIFKKEKLED